MGTRGWADLIADVYASDPRFSEWKEFLAMCDHAWLDDYETEGVSDPVKVSIQVNGEYSAAELASASDGTCILRKDGEPAKKINGKWYVPGGVFPRPLDTSGRYTVTAKPFQVGQRVTSFDYGRLPNGSVVTGIGGHYFKTTQGWVSAVGAHYITPYTALSSPRDLVFLP